MARQAVGRGGPRPPGTPPPDAGLSPGAAMAHGHGRAAEAPVRLSGGAVVPLVRGWPVTPRAPALAPRAPMVRLSQAAPSEGVLHSLPLLILLKLLIWRSPLTYTTYGA